MLQRLISKLQGLIKRNDARGFESPLGAKPREDEVPLKVLEYFIEKLDEFDPNKDGFSYTLIPSVITQLETDGYVYRVDAKLDENGKLKDHCINISNVEVYTVANRLALKVFIKNGKMNKDKNTMLADAITDTRTINEKYFIPNYKMEKLSQSVNDFLEKVRLILIEEKKETIRKRKQIIEDLIP